jgi:hypothetical protein
MLNIKISVSYNKILALGMVAWRLWPTDRKVCGLQNVMKDEIVIKALNSVLEPFYT